MIAGRKGIRHQSQKSDNAEDKNGNGHKKRTEESQGRWENVEKGEGWSRNRKKETEGWRGG